MAANNYKTYTVSVNDIKRGLVETGDRAIALQIVRLCMTEPGTNPLFPELGVGLVKYCMGKTETDLDDILDHINNQIIRFLPEYRFANIELEISDDTNHTLIINIQINDTVYIYNTAETDTPITLGDLKN